MVLSRKGSPSLKTKENQPHETAKNISLAKQNEVDTDGRGRLALASDNRIQLSGVETGHAAIKPAVDPDSKATTWRTVVFFVFRWNSAGC